MQAWGQNLHERIKAAYRSIILEFYGNRAKTGNKNIDSFNSLVFGPRLSAQNFLTLLHQIPVLLKLIF
jgi:hypothetical protein